MGLVGVFLLLTVAYVLCSPPQRAACARAARALLGALVAGKPHAPVGAAGQLHTWVSRQRTRAAVTSPVVSPVPAPGPGGGTPLPQGGAAVAGWSCADVAAWLRLLELGEYAPAFLSARVDGDLLLCLSADDLRSLGVVSPLHVKKLQLRLAALRAPHDHRQWPASATPALPTRRALLLAEAVTGGTLVSASDGPFVEDGSDSGTRGSGAPSVPGSGPEGGSRPPANSEHGCADACVGLLRSHGGWVTACTWCPDGSLLAGGGDGTITLWDAPDSPIAPPAPSVVLEGHAGAVRALLPLWRHGDNGAHGSREGRAAVVRRCASVGDDGTLRIWAIHCGRLHAASTEPPACCEAVVAAHGDAVFALLALPSGQAGTASDCMPRLLTCSADATARVWHLRTDIGAGASAIVAGAVLQGHSDYVLASCLLLSGAGSAKPAGEPSHREECIIVTASWDSTLRVWQLPAAPADPGDSGPGDRAPTCMRTLRGHKGGVRAVAALPGWRCVSAGADGALRIWQPRMTGAAERVLRQRGPLRSSLGAVLALATLPHRHEVACAREDGRVHVWRLSVGNDAGPCSTLEGHTKRVYALAWRPADGLLASGSRDRTLRLWQLASR